MKAYLLLPLSLVAALICAPAASAFQGGDKGSHAEKPKGSAPVGEKAKIGPTGDPYLLDTDPVSNEKLGPPEKLTVVQHEGRELRFANEQNAKAFQADPQKYLAAVDAALVRQQTPFYPLQTCVVSDEKLDAQGKPFDFIYKNRLVRFSSEAHKAKFLADPTTYLAKLDQAVVVAQKPKYGPATCVVSDEAFGGEMGEPVEYVVGNRLIRLCCDGCRKKVNKDPLKYLGMIDKAGSKGAGDAKGKGHGKDGHGDGHDH